MRLLPSGREPRTQAKKLMFLRADVSIAGRAVRTVVIGRFPIASAPLVRGVFGRAQLNILERFRVLDAEMDRGLGLCANVRDECEDELVDVDASAVISEVRATVDHLPRVRGPTDSSRGEAGRRQRRIECLDYSAPLSPASSEQFGRHALPARVGLFGRFVRQISEPGGRPHTCRCRTVDNRSGP